MTFIDFTAAFDTESQLFLEEALSKSVKVRMIIQSIFSAATGYVRIIIKKKQNKKGGSSKDHDPFDTSRGALQGDIFSSVTFIARLMQTFRSHDLSGQESLLAPLPINQRIGIY